MNLRNEVEALFYQLADLDSRGRERYFSDHAVNWEVRREVEALLANDHLDDSIDALIGREMEVALVGSQAARAPEQCGPYRLLKPIGCGGMSEVWLAERTDGMLKRPVALKLPYAGASSAHFAERLNREKDILESLVHPGIARLYDAGIAEGGRPFLALEYVEGTNLAAYCDAHALSIRKRIDLFLQVLAAVQFAHSRLVIHRDLKPSNILVTDASEVKLLDFGIAKLMTGSEARETELTEQGGRVLTLSYASPEQISSQPVTTASDVFSLGVILYELLSGERPFVPARDSRAALEEAILQAEPQRPSQRTANPDQARARSATRHRLRAQLKGDLDLIVLKALRKQPVERYTTVDAFRADIERHLASEAVLAQPRSVRYRVRKFVLRQKLGVLSAAAIFLALAGGLSAALWQAGIARQEARTSAAVQVFTEDIFRANSVEQPDPVRARETTARQLLDVGARKVAGSLNDAPAAKLRMLSILGSLYVDLGLGDQAVTVQKQRVALARKVYGARNAKVVPALVDLGAAMHPSRAVNESEAVLNEAKSILDASRDTASTTRARLLSVLAEHYASSDLPKSIAFAKESISIYRKYPPSAAMGYALYLAGLSYTTANQNEAATQTLSEAISLSKRFKGDPNAELPRYYAYLAQAELSLFRYPEAEHDYHAAYQYARALSGDDDVDTIETGSRLGAFLTASWRPLEALTYLGKAKDACLRTKGPNDPFYTPQMLIQYGMALEVAGRPEEALRNISDAVENRRRNRPGTWYLGQMLEDQAWVLIDFGQYQKAQQLLDEGLQIRAKVSRKMDTNYTIPRLKLALLQERADEAADLINRRFSISRRASIQPLPRGPAQRRCSESHTWTAATAPRRAIRSRARKRSSASIRSWATSMCVPRARSRRAWPRRQMPEPPLQQTEKCD